jgi:octaprenyl-diphosphate synthase
MFYLKEVKKVIEKDINLCNSFITSQLTSNISLIDQINKYIMYCGGKRLRVYFLILVAKLLNYKGDNHYKIAAIIEFIHTASLMHDDVIDQAEIRRKNISTNKKFGNEISVLTGDFLYSRAFQIMTNLKNINIMKVLSDATNTIARGEILQLANRYNINITEAQYRKIIYCKTSKLFEASCDSVVILNGVKYYKKESIHRYGLHIGNAFQMSDDILDYTSSSTVLGKNIKNDLIEGRITLPIIYTLVMVTKKEKKFIKKVVAEKKYQCINEICNLVKKYAALRKSIKILIKEIVLAKNTILNIPQSIYKCELLRLCDYIIKRVF